MGGGEHEILVLPLLKYTPKIPHLHKSTAIVCVRRKGLKKKKKNVDINVLFFSFGALHVKK